MFPEALSRDHLDALLSRLVLAALACTVLLPFAQGRSELFGWLPLWLVGLPLAAWLGLRLCRMADAGRRPLPALAGRTRRRPAAVEAARRRGAMRRAAPAGSRHAA